MSVALEVDDLDVGMFVTVIKGAEYSQGGTPGFGPENHQMGGRPPKTVEMMSFYKGKVLRIAAIDLPYLSIEHMVMGEGGRREPQHITMDIREVCLKKLSNEFVTIAEPSYKNELREEKSPSWTFDQEG